MQEQAPEQFHFLWAPSRAEPWPCGHEPPGCVSWDLAAAARGGKRAGESRGPKEKKIARSLWPGEFRQRSAGSSAQAPRLQPPQCCLQRRARGLEARTRPPAAQRPQVGSCAFGGPWRGGQATGLCGDYGPSLDSNCTRALRQGRPWDRAFPFILPPGRPESSSVPDFSEGHLHATRRERAGSSGQRATLSVCNFCNFPSTRVRVL